jgi:Flp pilus assembly pilin Flp
MRLGGVVHCCATAVSKESFGLKFWSEFWSSEDAQGITEYGAILAFVSLLVALTFSVTNGSLMPAVSAAFSAVAGQLNSMASTAANASGS